MQTEELEAQSATQSHLSRREATADVIQRTKVNIETRTILQNRLEQNGVELNVGPGEFGHGRDPIT